MENKKKQFRGTHWSKMPNANEIKLRILKSRDGNLEYKEKIKKRMTGENNSGRI